MKLNHQISEEFHEACEDFYETFDDYKSASSDTSGKFFAREKTKAALQMIDFKAAKARKTNNSREDVDKLSLQVFKTIYTYATEHKDQDLVDWLEIYAAETKNAIYNNLVTTVKNKQLGISRKI